MMNDISLASATFPSEDWVITRMAKSCSALAPGPGGWGWRAGPPLPRAGGIPEK